MINKVAIILVNYRDYAEQYLADCLASLRRQDFIGTSKIFIVDNEATAKTVNYLATNAPEAEVITNKENDGWCKGNNDGIKRAITQGFEYFVLLNLDTVVEENWLSELTRTADQAPNWGAIQSRLMLWPEKEKINSVGNSLHYLGFGYSAGGYQKWPMADPFGFAQGRSRWSASPERKRGEPMASEITYFSGAAVLLKKEALDKVGLFDEEFWMYHDDLDLSWRLRLAGYQIYLAPLSVVYHKYQFSKSIQQYYWMEHNRFICLLTNYKLATGILILPALIIMELGLLFFALLRGFLIEKMRVYGWFLKPSSWSYLIRRKKKISQLRQVKDREIVKYLTGEIKFQEVNNLALKVANPIFNLYWQVVRRLIFW
ncbi:MAG: glycosyltransferase family 2 protein [Patescibacteria group bacterium]